jgi:hypothetical protein
MLGLDYKAANLLSDVLAAPALAWLPSDVRRGVLEAGMSVGKAAASPIRCGLRRRQLPLEGLQVARGAGWASQRLRAGPSLQRLPAGQRNCCAVAPLCRI